MPQPGGASLPVVPTQPQGVPQFEQDINQYIDQANQDMVRQLDEAGR